MRRLASLMTLVKLVLLVYLANHVDFVVGRGPDKIPTPPVWGSPKVECSLFRNESVLRPLFGVWPEDIADVPFLYCCEYQPGVMPSGFELSNYTYGPNGGNLQPAPYHDLGIVDRDVMGYNLLHWNFWRLPTKQFSASMLYCDVTDLQALYFYRLQNEALVRGVISFSLVLLVVVVLVITPKYKKFREIYKNMQQRQNPDVSYTSLVSAPEVTPSAQAGAQEIERTFEPPKETDKEEVFSDFCHILLLSLLGSCLMEGIAHSPIGGWRSQLMFNMAVAYTYLTFFAIISVVIRHWLCPNLNHAADWRWQKVFGQLAAQLMMGTYLVLVEDVSGRSLDAVTGLVLGTCVGASVWSGGVELVIIARAIWQKLIKKYLLGDDRGGDSRRPPVTRENSLASDNSLGNTLARGDSPGNNLSGGHPFRNSHPGDSLGDQYQPQAPPDSPQGTLGEGNVQPYSGAGAVEMTTLSIGTSARSHRGA